MQVFLLILLCFLVLNGSKCRDEEPSNKSANSIFPTTGTDLVQYELDGKTYQFKGGLTIGLESTNNSDGSRRYSGLSIFTDDLKSFQLSLSLEDYAYDTATNIRPYSLPPIELKAGVVMPLNVKRRRILIWPGGAGTPVVESDSSATNYLRIHSFDYDKTDIEASFSCRLKDGREVKNGIIRMMVTTQVVAKQIFASA
jgi:hypothetical protein